MDQPLCDMQDLLEARVDVLDARKNGWPEHDEKRRESRRPLRTRCELRLLQGTGPEIATLSAFARNQTFCGLSIVLDTQEPVTPGRPVEVLLSSAENQRTHLAGIVVFCRSVDSDCYELGIEVKASSTCSILTHDIKRAKALYDWFATALRVRG